MTNIVDDRPSQTQSAAYRKRFDILQLFIAWNYCVEIRLDGTGVIRDIETGFPTYITSAAASRIAKVGRDAVEQAAAEEIKHPAVWHCHENHKK
jgi:hypothetical protein